MNTTLISPTAAQPKRVYFVDSSTQTTVDGANVEIRDETNVSIYKEHERDFREEHFPMPPHELQRSVSEDDKNEPDLRSVSSSSRFVFFDKFVFYILIIFKFELGTFLGRIKQLRIVMREC